MAPKAFRIGKASITPGRVVGAVLTLSMIASVLFAPGLLALAGRINGGGVIAATGYEQLVNELVADRGWLQVVYGTDGTAKIELTRTRVSRDPRLVRFVNSSYLRQDLGDTGLWELSADGRRVERISRFAHLSRAPFVEGRVWTGDLLFRDGIRDSVALTRGGEAFELTAQGGRSIGCDIELFRNSPPPPPQHDYTICHRGVRIVTVVLIGDRVLLRSMARPDQMGVQVNGRPVELNGPASVSWRVVDPGAAVSFRTGGRSETFNLQQTAAAVSRWTPTGRINHVALVGFGDAVSAALAGEPSQARTTTLDRDFQTVSQAALDTVAATLASSRGGVFRAAVTMMDASNGEVLAMASYPSDMESLPTTLRRTRRGQALVDRNHNLDLMPIGSVAKAPISMAIIEADRRHVDQGIASLRIEPAAAPFRELMGMDLGETFPADHSAGGGPIGYREFLEQSSNKYALALLMLAFGEDPGRSYAGAMPSELYELSGVARRDAPHLTILRRATRTEYGYAPSMEAAPPLPWAATMATLFDVESEQRRCAYELDVWRGWKESTPACDSPFAAASPEREALGLNVIRVLSQDYLMTILGGSRSSWTTIKVAEMFSRIVTGRAVSARLTRVRPDETPATGLAARAEVRNLVLEGLRRVPVSGTGVRIGLPAALGYGEDVRFFAKTGTPDVETSHAVPASQALQALIAARCGLTWDAGSRRLVFAGVRREDLNAWLAQSMPTRCRRVIESSPASVGAIIAEMDRISRSSVRGVEDLPRGLTIDARGEVTAAPMRLLASPQGRLTPTGHVFALVVARYAPGSAEGAPPVRALTIVVNVQRRQGNTPAISVASLILADPRVRDWVLAELEAPRAR